MPKVADAKISIAEIVKQICAPLSCTNECLVPGDRFLEMALGVLLICFCEVAFCLRKRRYCRYGAAKDCNKTGGHFHLKFSINSSTSRRLSGETLPGPLCAPLYCHSSLCSNNRRSRSRESLLSLKVSAAVSTSTMFGSMRRLPDARAAFKRTTLDASA